MKQKTALIIAAGVTAFMLVTAGAVIQVTSQTAAAQTTAQATPAATLVVPTTDPNATQFKQFIDEANSRIQSLKDENAKLRAQLNQSNAGNTAPAQTAASQINADAAAQAALNLAPGAQLLSTPELVNFQGTPAYEVALDAGTVYIDAASGQPLYAISARDRNRQSVESHNEHEEHEEHEHSEGGNS